MSNLTPLQSDIGAGNASRGFHDQGKRLRADLANWLMTEAHRVNLLADATDADELAAYKDELVIAQLRLSDAKDALRNYYMAKLALIVTEAAEAIEELRTGHAADERYYPTSQYNQFRDSTDPELGLAPNKPEGVPSEIADIVIRCFDFASEAGFDLGDAIDEKLEYNGTRGFRHGNKAL